MKFKYLFTVLLAMNMINSGISARDLQLPAPGHKCGTTLDKALQLRRSVRDFNPGAPVGRQMMSDLLWAAAGVNRPEDGRRTNPTALNKQEIDVYVFTADGVSLYDAASNSLRKVVSGDHRALVAGTKEFMQDFVLDAPVSLVLVGDTGKFEGDPSRAAMMAMADAGIVSQNINLFCAANGLATVPRATMDGERIRQLLGLDARQIPLLNNPVGYPR